MSEIYLYAEVLRNIKQITLYASLRTDKNESTKIDISSDRRYITVSHEDQTAKLLLPLQVSGTAEVTIPVQKAKDLSVRLQLEDTDAVNPRIEDASHDGPWSAGGLCPGAQIRCINCESLIMRSNVNFQWKDLPSENWAEMMDFWHCHKPHDAEEESAKKSTVAEMKGYGATSRIKASYGIGLVDTSTFLLAKEDCSGVQVTATVSPNGHRAVECSVCSTSIGFEEKAIGEFRLYKWAMAVQPKPAADWQSFQIGLFVSEILLALIDSQMVHKFVIHSGAGTGLLIWVFNPDLQYTTSQRPSKQAFRAIKVFYQAISDPQKVIEEHSTSVEEVFLPSDALRDLHEVLTNSTATLPPVARQFQEWQVGLLDRYES